MEVNDAIIIGAGPAGLAAAIQLRRYGIDSVVFERQAVGGLLRNANMVENYPGFPGGISGVDLVHRFELQAREHQVTPNLTEVLQLDFDGDIFTVETCLGTYAYRVAVIASGTKPRRFLEVDIADDVAHRVFYEVYPLFEQTGKTVAVVGAGDAAFDYALNLARYNQVFLLNRTSAHRCLPLLWERAKTQPAIHYIDNITISKVETDPGDRLHLECSGSGETIRMHVDYLIGALGRDAQLDFLSPRVQEHAQKLESQGRLYFIGDVKHGIYRQTSIAVGDGVIAAMKIYKQFMEGSI